MGYVFQFLKDSVVKTVDKATGRSTTNTTTTTDVDVANPLLTKEDSNTSYGSAAPITTTRSIRIIREEEDEVEGFTDEYIDYTHSDKALLNAQLVFIFYIGVAILGYSYIFEKWSIIDSIYFAVTVFTTVGYGDLTPSTDYSRLFTICFAFGGVIILGAFLGIIGTRLYEVQQDKMSYLLQNGRTKVLEQFGPEDSTKEQLQKESSSPHFFLFDVFAILFKLLPMIVILFCIALPLVYYEKGWDPIMGLYWMVITGMTIGFGDYSPATDAGKIICIIFLPLSTALFGELLGQIASAYMDRNASKIENAFLRRVLTLGDIETMDVEKDGKVKKHEFLSYMLVTMQKCSQDDINQIMTLFEKLDKDGNGDLNKDDLSDKYHLSIKPGVVAKSTRSLNVK